MSESASGRWIAGLAAAAAMATTSIPAGATVAVRLQTSDGFGPIVTSNDSADLELDRQISDGLSNARGYSNLIDGVLRAQTFASAPGLANVATASFTDVISFTSGSGGTAYLDWSFAGTADTGRVYQNAAVLQLNVTRNGALTYELHALVSSGTCPPIYTTCSVGNSVSRTGAMPIVIRTGEYSVQATLTATSFSGDVDFGDTAHLYLRLPGGVGITSQSGQFLAAAPPISAVAEPPVAVLLLSGAAGLAAWTRRRRSQRPSASV